MADIIELKPVFHEKIWGGSRMRDAYGYDIPSDKTGEYWAISAHPNGDCPVLNPEFEGMTLSQLWDQRRDLFGDIEGDRFPLLIKIIDAAGDLSIQVHPDDAYAAEHENGSLGKRECWKCHKETSVAAFGIPYRIDDDKGIAIAHAPNEAGHITIDTANANALAIVPALGCVPGEIRDYLSKRCGYKPVGARASKAPSLGNTCTSCDALQGSRYLFEEPSSPFALTAINKLPALEFVRVEVAGVFGVPATRTDFDQALFTWARDHHAKFHKQLGEGIYL